MFINGLTCENVLTMVPFTSAVTVVKTPSQILHIRRRAC